MDVLIVYDSVFGNTEKIAHAIGNSFEAKENVETVRANQLKPGQLNGVALLIVGSPTRAFSPTKSIKTFLRKIPSKSLKGVRVAAFDTRIDPVDVDSPVLDFFIKIFGYAAKPIADKLRKKGGRLVAQPEGFIVKGSEGPLKDGECERAANWVKMIVQTA